MLDLKLIREKPERVKEGLKSRKIDISIVNEILELDEKRRKAISDSDQLKAERNQISSKIAKEKREGNNEKAKELQDRAKEISTSVKEQSEIAKNIDNKVRNLVLHLPNIPNESVPIGNNEEDNITVKTWGDVPEFNFDVQPHWDLGPEIGMIDFDTSAKLSGARFVLLRKQIAKLSRALQNFMLDLHTTEHGYEEVLPPHIVTRETMLSTGQLPKFEEEAFRTDPDDMFLIPTAEVPLVAQHKDEILEMDRLPLKYAAFTPCYRREAGSHGKDVRGMVRVHQFDKVELVWFTKPEESYDALEELTGHAEKVLKLLKLPYRVVTLCTADLGFASAKTYDVEVWLPSYSDYKEISSCSNTEDFQARRCNTRFRGKDNRIKYVHTLNGSGLAIGRTLIAIIENYQRTDGRIDVPDVLIPYMGTEVIG
ncbi:MAG: serine--tRNA ligase [Thermotogota bacterium]|nr:serine--tRNA ligase [Thermotogota bacterium]